MPNKQHEPSPLRRNTSLRWALACAALAVGVAGVYLGLYRTKGYTLPVGFDAPWYVWRASYVAAHGLGPLGTSTRPGSSVLAAVLGGLTGRSQFTVAVLLGPVLAGMFALALGALVWWSLGRDRWRWLAAVVVGGTVLGATRLVDENVATLLFLCLLVGALTLLVAAAAADGSRWGFLGSVMLLVAAGLAHWLFLAVFGLMLLGAVILLAPGSRRRSRAEGLSPARTEAGTLASAGLWVAGAMSLTVFGLLRAPANTIQLREDPSRFVPKLTNDASRLRLWLLGPVAAFGGWVLLRPSEAHKRHERRRAVLLCLLAAWLVVCVGGIVFGLATKKLPPHRFLELTMVVPGVIAIAEVVGWLGRRVRRSAWVVAAAACVLLAIPGISAWYASGAPKPWMSPEALREARIVCEWAAALPDHGPFIVLVSPFGPAGTEAAALKERTIRTVLPPDLQVRFRLLPGDASDIGGPAPPDQLGEAMRSAIQPYRNDARAALRDGAPVAVMKAFDPNTYSYLAAIGAVVGPGVVVHQPRGAGVPRPVPQPPSEASAFPGVLATALWTIVFLGLFAVAGWGWTRVVAGRDVHPAVLFGMMPAVGAGALILAGTVLSRVGVPLGTGASWVVWVLVAAGGVIASRSSPAPAGDDRQVTLRT